QISPGIAHSLSRLCPPHICTVFPDRFRALEVHAFLPRLHTSYAIPVRQASVLLTASFRSHLAVSTLAVRLTIPPVGLVRDFHPLVSAPCRAHMKRRRQMISCASYDSKCESSYAAAFSPSAAAAAPSTSSWLTLPRPKTNRVGCSCMILS